MENFSLFVCPYFASLCIRIPPQISEVQSTIEVGLAPYLLFGGKIDHKDF